MTSEIYRDMFIPLAGAYQPYNAAVAITALDVLKQKGWPVTEDSVRKGLSEVKWPGAVRGFCRKSLYLFWTVRTIRTGWRQLQRALKRCALKRRLYFSMGVMADKDLDAMLSFILPLASFFVTVSPRNPRAMAASELAGIICKGGGEAIACRSAAEGVNTAFSAAGGRRRCLCTRFPIFFSGHEKSGC